MSLVDSSFLTISLYSWITPSTSQQLAFPSWNSRYRSARCSYTSLPPAPSSQPQARLLSRKEYDHTLTRSHRLSSVHPGTPLSKCRALSTHVLECVPVQILMNVGQPNWLWPSSVYLPFVPRKSEPTTTLLVDEVAVARSKQNQSKYQLSENETTKPARNIHKYKNYLELSWNS